MITILWIIISILLIFAIMIHNPKSQGIGGQNQLFVSTRSSEATLNKVTWCLIGLFFSFAIYIAIVGNID